MESGTRLGPYEVQEQLGAGGMGEVYLAQDTRLGRRVAVKILPEEFAADSDRLARFEQEARAAAALNHPHIAAVHDVGCEDGVHFMVQEYLEGQSLRDLLAAGTPPLKKSLALAAEIGQALRAAHRAGIVHRDLKPDNVFVTPDGHAKVLDFGLAKLSEGVGLAGDGTKSPTVVASMTGQIMGTAGYMAPEQIDGAEVDHRADLFAFGCVLYEMTTGQQPFAGKNVYETLGRIVSDEPAPLERSVSDVPTELQRIVRKALAKDPEFRYQSAGDVVVDLKVLGADMEAGTTELTAPGTAVAEAPSAGGMSWRLGAAVVVAALALGALGARWLAPEPAGSARPPVRFDIGLPGEDTDFDSRSFRTLAVSPDGGTIAFTYDDAIWVRSIEEMETVPLRNTADAWAPVFSPDGAQIAFVARGGVKRIAVSGGAAVTVSAPEGEIPTNLHWGTDGFIYWAVRNGGIHRAPETGGAPEEIVPVHDDGRFADTPWLLPDERRLLFVRSASGGWNDGEIVARSLDTGDEVVLVEGGTSPRYVDTGHLLYVRDGVLYALRLDVDTLAVTGGPVALVEAVRGVILSRTGASNFDVSRRGDLVYTTGTSGRGAAGSQLAWVGREGDAESLPFAPQPFSTMSLSADGARLAIERFDDENTQIWLYRMDRPGGQRLTSEGDNFDPVWSPDGTWVYFGHNADGRRAILRRRADLSAAAELVYESDSSLYPWSISSDGAWLLFTRRGPEGQDISRLALDADPGGEPAVEVLVAPGNNWGPSVSPDGRFFAYQSGETGRNEIYINEIETGQRWLVSTAGGFDARWARGGDQLIYKWRDMAAYAVAIETEPELSFSEPVAIEWRGQGNYEVSADGLRTLQRISADAGSEEAPEERRILVVLNWFRELLDRAPVDP